MEDEEKQLKEEIDSESQPPSGLRITVIAIAAAFFACLLGLFPFWFYKTATQAGLFGDSFGFINAILNGMALGFVALAIFLQIKELSLQRKEIRLTLIEAQRARNEYAQMVHAQRDTEKRLFLSAYVSALQTYNELSQDLLLSETSSVDEVIAAARKRKLQDSIHNVTDQMEFEFEKQFEAVPCVNSSLTKNVLGMANACRLMLDTYRLYGGSDSGHEVANSIQIMKQQINSVSVHVSPKIREKLNSATDQMNDAQAQIGSDHSIADIHKCWACYQNAYQIVSSAILRLLGDI